MFFQRRRRKPDPGAALPPGGRRDRPTPLGLQAARLLTARVQERPNPHSAVVLGSGRGGLAITLAGLWPGCHVLGLDPSSDACRQAMTAAKEAGLADQLEFKAGRLDNLLLPDGQAELILGAGYLSECQIVSRALNELGRVLHRGGEILLVEPLRGGASGLVHPAAHLGLEDLRTQLAKGEALFPNPGLEIVAPDGEAPVCLVTLRRPDPQESPTWNHRLGSGPAGWSSGLS